MLELLGGLEHVLFSQTCSPFSLGWSNLTFIFFRGGGWNHQQGDVVSSIGDAMEFWGHSTRSSPLTSSFVQALRVSDDQRGYFSWGLSPYDSGYYQLIYIYVYVYYTYVYIYICIYIYILTTMNYLHKWDETPSIIHWSAGTSSADLSPPFQWHQDQGDTIFSPSPMARSTFQRWIFPAKPKVPPYIQLAGNFHGFPRVGRQRDYPIWPMQLWPFISYKY